MQEKWYHVSKEQVLKQLQTDERLGLSEDEVQARLKKYGPNRLAEGKKETIFSLFIKQFLDPLIYLLIAAAALVFIVGAYMDGIIITVMLLINAVIATIQEGRAQNILSSLKKLLKTKATVIRQGKQMIVDDEAIVPGDIIVLESGSRVPADARILVSYDLSLDEAVLTGESAAVHKSSEPIKKEVPVYEQKNMLFMGTVVTDGSGRAVVTATNGQTEVGRLQKEIEKIETEVPLERELKRISRIILTGAICLCIGLFFYGWWVHYSIYELFITLTVLFVAIVPEELIVVLTMILVGGARRLARKNVLVKRLRAVEALGHAEVIVMDKTGTLTRNEMVVEKAYAGRRIYKISGEGYSAHGQVTTDHRQANNNQDVLLYEIARASVLLNTATLEKEDERFNVKGSATTAAGAIFAYKLGIELFDLEKKYSEVYKLPFSSRLRFSAGLYKYQADYIVYVIGSPELLLEKSSNTVRSDQEVLQAFLDEGYRVVGYGRLIEKQEIADPKEYLQNIFEKGIEFLGFLAMQDAVREEAPEMVERARRAGLQIIMATGDHKKTAEFVGEKAGIIGEKNNEINEIMDGREFRQLSDQQLLEKINQIRIYSRVTPPDKVRLIMLLHEMNKAVAMVGDGVNDAPALIAADLGIAMGERGSSVAHEAADLVLLKDSFATIIDAVQEGRHIFYRLRQGVLYFVITDFALIALMLLTIFLQLPLALTAIQIIWIHVFSDGFFSIALAQEPVEPGLLEKKWLASKKTQKLLDKKNFFRALYLSLPMVLITFSYYLLYLREDLDLARTVTFASLALFKWYNAWNCRSETQSIFKLGLFANRALMFSLCCVAFLLLAAIYVPFLQPIFHTKPLSLRTWILLLLTNSCVIILEEVRKYLMHIRRKGEL